MFFRCFRHRICLSMLLGIGAWQRVAAQDVRPSQPYAAGLLLNPALAGVSAVQRVSFTARDQYPGLGLGFLTGALTAEARIERWRGAVGATLVYDRAGDAPLNRTQLTVGYAYHTRLTERWSASGAVSIGFGVQNGNLDRYVFGDQLVNDGSTIPTNETISYLPVIYPTVGVGVLLYEKQGWLGAAIHHANAPKLGDWATAARLPPRVVLHGGYKFYLLSALSLNEFYEFSLSPIVNVQLQGATRGADVGFSVQYTPVVLGVLYRNPVLFSAREDQHWLVLQLGLRQPGWVLGYSYDLGLGRQVGGAVAHELTFRLDQADFSGLLKKKSAPKRQPFVNTPAF